MNNFIPVVNHSLKYNPSIDGLRGIAISLVLIFHIWPEYFSFGYVGVDIFFVLSGYADDDHHSVDGSIEQAKYLNKYIFEGDNSDK